MHVVVVGGGIVGLASAFHLLEHGHAVTVIDRPTEEMSASCGNAGAIAVTECVPASVPGILRKVPKWLLDPLGPLYVRPGHAPRLAPWMMAFLAAGKIERVQGIARALADLNARCLDDVGALMERIGIADQLHRVGSLVVYPSEQARQADALEWDLKRRHGIRAQEVGRDGIMDLEPALGPAMTCGVFQPDWAHVDDPAAIVQALGAYLRAQGVTLRTGEVADVARTAAGASGVRLTDGATVAADAVVVAAGAWSGKLAKAAGDRVLLESERGYNTTLPAPGVTVNREIIFGADKFVATPLSIGLRIGGAAEFAGFDAPPNYGRCNALVTLARRALPDLNAEGGTKWMGHRPATPDSLPVIGPSPTLRNLYYAFGHGHLGLTQSASTGALIADMVDGRTPPINCEPFSIARFG